MGRQWVGFRRRDILELIGIPFDARGLLMGAIAAAVIIRKQKDIVAAFRTAGATSPKSATTAAALGIHEGMVFEKLRRRGVVKEASPAKLYLDEARWTEHRAHRQRLALLLIGCLVLAGAALLLIGPS